MMLSWIVIILLVLVFLFFLKMKHFKHRFFAVVLILLLIFIYVSATRIMSENNINLASLEGLVKGGKLYFSWLANLGGNIKDLAGNAVKMDWAGNSTVK